MASIILMLLVVATAAPVRAAEPPTARELVDRIKQHVQTTWDGKNTIDTFKAGDPDTRVTGIAVTFLATLDVLKRAAASGKNFVITHEPAFYSHYEHTNDIENDQVLAAKRAFIKEHNMVIWRFHDYWHAHHGDGVMIGMTEKLGWQKYLDAERPFIYKLPPTTVGKLASGLQKKLGARAVRVIGRPDMPVTTVALLPGAPNSRAHIRALEIPEIEVILVGEAPEWESLVYVQDAIAAGRKNAMILLGHTVSEEAGMEYCARWLRDFIKEVPVEFVPAGEPFWCPKQ